MMSIGDSLHLSTAIINGATEFHTRDKNSKKGNVKLMGPAGMSPRGKIAGKYDLSIVSPEENSYPFCPEQVMPRRKTRPTSAEPKAAFIAAAKAAGADEDEKRWEARLKAVAKLPAKPVKKGSAHRGSTR